MRQFGDGDVESGCSARGSSFGTKVSTAAAADDEILAGGWLVALASFICHSSDGNVDRLR
jgi:hypothetical protein